MTADTPVQRLRTLLANVRPCGAGFTARCPAHDDRTNSLKVDPGDDGRVLLHCFAGCDPEQVVAALGLTMADLFSTDGKGEGAPTPPDTTATVHHPAGCTLAQYAAAKRLPIDVLRSFGLSDLFYQGAPAVKLPYHDSAGIEAVARFRVRLHKGASGDDRFRWRSGSKPCLYGLERLALARERGYVALVEGESNCHTLWYHDEPAVGVPGASLWRDERDAPALDGIDTIYAVREPDAGGKTLLRHLAASRLRDRVRVVELGAHKDPSALYLDDPARFPARWRAALATAVPLADELAAETEAEHAAAWEAGAGLARAPDILALVAETLAARVAGEARVLKLLYLIVVSRFLPRPVSAGVKGPSSGGKSYLVEQVLRLFPADASYTLSAMSERALAYSDEPLAHRFLVLYEAAGLAGDFASYLVRSLLSEGRIRYETVEKTREGLKPRLIEREGPTGLLVTTTAVHLHPENETRMLSIPVTDTPDQTRAIFRALATGTNTTEPDLTPWHALQTWLAGAEHRVEVPFALALADAVPPTAVRLRRDFGMLLTLIRAHALLHQASRGRDAAGRVVAEVGDYAAVRGLVADLVAEGVEATVPATVRETVAAVRTLTGQDGATLAARLREDSDATISLAAIARALKVDKSAASRRVSVARDRGYLRNLETKRGQPARIALGEPLPEETPILPEPEVVRARCSVAGVTAGIPAPSPLARAPAVETEPTNGRACVDCGAALTGERKYRCAACAAMAA